MPSFPATVDRSLILFLLNTVLILADAAAGYHSIPLARSLMGIGSEEGESRSLTRGLALAVGISMFLNCFGYFRGVEWLLWLTTVMVLIDLAAQTYVRRLAGRRGG